MRILCLTAGGESSLDFCNLAEPTGSNINFSYEPEPAL